MIKLKREARLKSRDVNLVERELNRVAAMGGGNLDERRLWEEARDLSAPLHPEFTWNDTEAAELYRDQEARQIIQAVYIVDERSGDEVRLWHNVVIEDQSVYVQLTRIVQDDSLKEQVLMSIRSDIAGARARLSRFSEFASHARALDRIIAALGRKRKK